VDLLIARLISVGDRGVGERGDRARGARCGDRELFRAAVYAEEWHVGDTAVSARLRLATEGDVAVDATGSPTMANCKGLGPFRDEAVAPRRYPISTASQALKR
jgi:hypothetical protein